MSTQHPRQNVRYNQPCVSSFVSFMDLVAKQSYITCDWLRGGPELPDEPVAEEARLPSIRLPHRPVALGHLRWPRHSGLLQREVVGSEVSLSSLLLLNDLG